MAKIKTHLDHQDIAVNRGENAVAGTWYELDSQLATRENIYIENTGVSHDWETAHVLKIRIFPEAASKDGQPQIALLNPGDSFSARFAPEIRIAVSSDINDGSWTFIETDNIIRK